MAKTAKLQAAVAELAVVVTTQYRGVFFGYVPEDQVDADVLPLRGARNCLYWTREVQGFMGLAATGPSASCRIGPRADIALRDITAVLRCTPEAVERWEAATWKP